MKTINNYQIKEVIGSGTYGNVHRAQHMKTKETVAIKIVNKRQFMMMPMLNRLTNNEISVLRNMDNKNIIKFIELIKTQTNTYYVYEYCNGENLFEILKAKKSFPEKTAIEYFI